MQKDRCSINIYYYELYFGNTADLKRAIFQVRILNAPFFLFSRQGLRHLWKSMARICKYLTFFPYLSGFSVFLKGCDLDSKFSVKRFLIIHVL
jgi:hypothetical protein